MPQFSYKARRRTGEVVQGMLEVADRSAALASDRAPGTVPGGRGCRQGRRYRRRRTACSAHQVRLARLVAAYLARGHGRKRKPKLQELSTFTQQLANLLHSGMPLTVALNSMTHLESKGISADVSKELRQDVMEGRSLSDSMAKQPRIFSDFYVNMVRAGESSGALVEVLRRMADHFERFAQVQAKFTSALIYPAFVAGGRHRDHVLFHDLHAAQVHDDFRRHERALALPDSNVDRHQPYLCELLVADAPHTDCGVILFKRFQASKEGRRKLDHWKMNMPVFGKVNKLNLFGQFARTLSTLLENGVPVLTALKITEQIMPNVILKEAIAKTREEVTDGKTIAQPLARSKVFPQLMVDLVKIGEDTGDVPGALKNVADTYENELAMALRVMTNMIEPVMIIVMALGVGFLLLSVLSAMFAITSNIAR